MTEQSPCVIAIAAHAADMEFAAGAALLKHAETGWQTHVINLTLGEKGNADMPPDEYAPQKRREAENAAGILETNVHFLPYADGELQVTPQAIENVAAWLRRLRPDVIISHWRHSIHTDHVAAFNLTRRAHFTAANPHFNINDLPYIPAARIYYADNWEDAESFQPFIYLDVSDFVDRWRRACQCFAIGRGEGGFPYWDWYEARTRLHGIMTGVGHAQSFAVEPHRIKRVTDLL